LPFEKTKDYSNTKILPSHEHEAITLGITGWKATSMHAWSWAWFSSQLIIINVDRTIWRARSEFFPVQAEIALDWEPRDHMALILLIFVESVRWGGSKDYNIIPIWLRNKNWIKLVATHTGTRISFHINLIQEYNKLVKI